MALQPRTPFDLMTAFGLASLHAGITLWYRWPVLLAVCACRLKPQQASEVNRMVNEKVTAVARGFVDARTEVLQITIAAMTGKLKLRDACNVPVTIVDASVRPALRAVTANARRLRRRS